MRVAPWQAGHRPAASGGSRNRAVFGAAAEVDDIDVTYDPVLGFPTKIVVDRVRNAVDDETEIAISDLVTGPQPRR